MEDNQNEANEQQPQQSTENSSVGQDAVTQQAPVQQPQPSSTNSNGDQTSDVAALSTDSAATATPVEAPLAAPLAAEETQPSTEAVPAPIPTVAPITAANAISSMMTNGLHRMTAHDMDLAELKVKIICLEKNNMALKMELKCAELQVAAKEKLDTKKTRLIELLDAKVTAMDKKNLRLIEMMEKHVREKDTHSHRLIEATKNMEDLSRRLVESERGRHDMRNINNELKAMLDSLEGKGVKIAKLAKEKVLKYKEENERMQRELDVFNDVPDEQAANPDGDGTPVSNDTGFAGLARNAEELCGQLEAAVAGKDWQRVEPVDELRAALVEAQRLVVLLRPAIEELLLSGNSTARNAAVEDREATLKMERRYKEQTNAKDREIVTLKDELTRLKAAIGQLVGLNLGGVAPAAATAEPVAPSAE